MRIQQAEQSNLDFRGLPSAICPCGSTILNIQVQFDPETYEIQYYFFDAECAVCGALLTAPCPRDLDV